MTVASTTNKVSYTATASQTTFAYTFKIFADADLKVYVNDVLKTLTTDYTVTNAGVTGGGNVIFGTGRTASEIITIERVITATQLTDYVENDPFAAETHENALDKLTMLAQQNESAANNSVRAPTTDVNPNMLLDKAATRATKMMGFDSNGDVTVSGSTMTDIDASVAAAFAGGVLASSYQFTGTGSQVAFTITGGVTAIPNAQALIITIDGVTQHTDTYTTAAAVVTFSTAPPLNADIQIRYNAYLGTATDAASATYNQGGTGASSRTVENKLQESVSVKDFGAVGDYFLADGSVNPSPTDDTAAMQAAVDYCIANEKNLIVSGSLYLTASINIDRAIGGTYYLTNFRITGVDSNSGFGVNTAIVMFSATSFAGTSAVSDAVTFDTIHFEVASAATAAYVVDGAYIRMQFQSCRFMRIKGMSALSCNTFSHYFDSCHMYGWTGIFYKHSYTSSNDISFSGCYVNSGVDFVDIGHAQGFRFTDNAIEACTGTPVSLKGTRGAEVTGNYFEANSLTTGSYYVDFQGSGGLPIAGAVASGNLFYLSTAQTNDANFYAMNWYGAQGAMSSGNWSTGKLHRTTTAERGAFNSKGDVDNQTNDSTKSITKALYPVQGSEIQLVQPATSAAFSQYNIKTDVVTKTYTADLFNAAATTDSEIVWQQPVQSLLIAVSMVLDEQFVASGLTDLNVLVGDSSDNNGVLQEAMDLQSNTVATRYKGRGVYWDGSTGVTELYKAAAYDWTAYATATGANLDTLTAGSVTFYFTYRSL